MVELSVYNMLAQGVSNLLDRHSEPGTYVARWGGLDRYGNDASGGVYVLRLEAGDVVASRKILLVK